MAVADATVLITAAKLDSLYLLRDIAGQIIIGPAVYQEVLTRGIEAGATEASYVRSAVNGGWVQMVRLSRGEQDLAEQLVRSTNLHRCEAESLALASDRRQRLIVDDKESRGMARALGVQYTGTAGILMEALAASKITTEAYEELVGRLANITWLSPSVVTNMLAKGSRV